MREDLLEAALVLSRAGTPLTVAALSTHMSRDDTSIRADLHELVESGEVSSCGDGTFSLTRSGSGVAEKTERKHRLLQEFFSRVLGMDQDAASKEACTLEHTVSEYAISRIGTFIDDAPCCRLDHPDTGQQTLAGEPEGTVIRIIGVRGCQRQERLMALGIVPGTVLTVVRNGRGKSLMIRVKGCEIAISREIAGSVVVEPAP